MSKMLSGNFSVNLMLLLKCALITVGALFSPTTLQAQVSEQFGSHIHSQVNELYSETYYRKDIEAVSTMVRLRHILQTNYAPISVYLGVSVERMLTPHSPLLLQNSISPTLGILYRPYDFVTMWAEYRHRFREQTEFYEKEDGPDPRVGVAAGKNWKDSSDLFGADAYGEIVSVPRLSDVPVGSGYLRAYAGFGFSDFHRLDLYTEWNEYLSDAPFTLGPSRHQIRGGGRWQYQSSRWNASMFIFKPWVLRNTSGSSLSEDLEALFVLGGYF